MRKQSAALRNSKSCFVELELEPVGARVRIENLAQLHSLVYSVLSTLVDVHSYDFVHRDIRIENLIRVNDGWLLIDWELAGKANQNVWWEGKLLPDSVRYHLAPYTIQTDLWQVGNLIKAEAISSVVAIDNFAEQLLAGSFSSARAALAAMWDVEA